MSFSPDGRYLLIDRLEGSEVSDIWVLDMEERGEPTSWLQSPADEFHARFSPDGKWIAYTSDESGSYEVYVRSFPGPGGKWQVSSGGGGDRSTTGQGSSRSGNRQSRHPRKTRLSAIDALPPPTR